MKTAEQWEAFKKTPAYVELIQNAKILTGSTDAIIR
jgi:hypothetical protein